VQQVLFLAMHFGGPWLGWDGITNNNNDKVDNDNTVKSTRQQMVGDGGGKGNSKGNGGNDRCNIEERRYS
jgi:hypothetical protein